MKKFKLLVLCILCFSLTGCTKLSEYDDYCYSALEVRYQNDFSHYQTMDELMEIDESFHDQAIIEVSNYFLGTLKVDQEKVSGELIDYFHYQVEKLFKQVKVNATTCKIKGNQVYVNVNYHPFDMSELKAQIDRLQLAYTTTILKIKKVSLVSSYQIETIYMTSIIECLDHYLEDIQYQKLETMSIPVKENQEIYAIDEDSLKVLDQAILGYNQ